MIERIYIIEEADVELFIGTNHCNLITLNNLFPRAKLRYQGKAIKILAIQKEADLIVSALMQMEELCLKYNRLDEYQVINIVKGKEIKHTGDDPGNTLSDTPSPIRSLIIYGLHGKAIYTRGENQQKLVNDFTHCDLCFALGAAGSGKTFIAICLAVKALKNKQVRRIILSRPAVEAGEKLGFLPGEMKDKLDPYLQPLYDALGELIPATKLKDYLDLGIIQIAPLAFMRGRTLNDAVIILDEAQNTTPQQMKMFLTRLGHNAKMIITGDLSQVDLPRGQMSGLRDASQRLNGIDGVSIIEMGREDIVRHPLVQRIVEVYETVESDRYIENK